MTSSIFRRTCLHPSTPVANILSILLFAPPIWQRVSIIKTETLSSVDCCPDTVAIDRKGSSCSSALLRSRIGSGFAEESSVGVILPLEMAASIEGIGTPASTRARLAALRQATSRAPSKLSTCRVMEIVDRGYKCVKRWLWNALEIVVWSSCVRLSFRFRRRRSISAKGAMLISVSIVALLLSR